MLHYAFVISLNGNAVLKPLDKVREDKGECMELELYGETLEEVKAQFKAHKADLKKEGLL